MMRNKITLYWKVIMQLTIPMAVITPLSKTWRRRLFIMFLFPSFPAFCFQECYTLLVFWKCRKIEKAVIRQVKVDSNLGTLPIWNGRNSCWLWYKFGNNSKEYDTSKELEKKRSKFMVRRSLKGDGRLIELW